MRSHDVIVSKKSLPPGPRSMPAVAVGYLRDSSTFYARCAARYGDPFLIPTPWGRLVVTGQPKGIETIFTAPPDHFGIYAKTVVEPFLGPTSLMVSSGPEHLRNRRLLMPRFHTRHITTYGQAMAEVTAEGTRRWRVGDRFAAQAGMHTITLEIILRVFFGARDERKAILRKALIEVQKAIGPLIAFFPVLRREFRGVGPWATFQRAIKHLDQVVYGMIAEARTRGYSEDILGMLVSLEHEGGGGYSDVEVRDALVTLVYAGHETLASSLAWALYWLHRKPEVLDRLREELKSVSTDGGPESLVHLPYLAAVCNESLRLGPVVPEVTRLLQQPLHLLGYDLPAGLSVAASISLAHLDESIYTNAADFQPERFLQHKYSQFEFLPFGGGTHRCLGASLATYEMKIVLATLLRSCRFSLATPGTVRASRKGVLLGPYDGIILIVEELTGAGAAAGIGEACL